MLIGLTGYSRAGKDEVARILVERHGFSRLAFADGIKRFLELQLGGLADFADVDWDEMKKDPEWRELLQRTGVAMREVFGEDVLVDRMHLGHAAAISRCVITDVRFENEAAAIREYGGRIWRVSRPDVGALNGHVSEVGIDAILADQGIDNDGSLDDLAECVEAALSRLMGG